jgi:eukaryotic-like serine/threonine-protein kinase
VPEVAFGPYVLVRRIAVGGMAEVYLARLNGPRGFEKPVVVKQILPQLARDPELLQMFIDEAAIAAKLSHPGIVQILDFGQQDGTFYLAMEYVDGLDLDELIRLARKANEDKRAVPVAHAVQIVAMLAQAVQYAHEAKDADGTPLEVIHRDISPQNVLLGRDGTVKLGDFGIARTSLRSNRTQTGVLRGKIAYLAPERFAGERASRGVDVYAMGVVLFEAIAGRRPFMGDDAGFIKAVMSQEPPALSSILSDTDPKLNAVLEKAICRRPEQRYESAQAFRQALLELGVASNSIELSEYISMMCERRDTARRERQEVIVAAPGRRGTETLPGPAVAVSDLATEAKAPVAGPPLSDGAEPTLIERPPQPVAATQVPTIVGHVSDAPTAIADTHAHETVLATSAMPIGIAAKPTQDDHDTAPPSSRAGMGRIEALLEWMRLSPLKAVAVVCAVGITVGWLASAALLGGVDELPPNAKAAPEMKHTVAEEQHPAEAVPVRIDPIQVEAPLLDGEDDTEAEELPRITPGSRLRPAKKKPVPVTKVVKPVEPEGFGELSLDTVPWSYVTLDGRDLGATPLAHVRLASGKHRLALRNPESGLSRTMTITIKADSRATMLVRLSDGKLLSP